jgi:hypothetical protein
MEKSYGLPQPKNNTQEEEKQNSKIVSELLEKNGLDFEEITFKEHTSYTKAFILKRENNENEGTVRLYRGVNKLDDTLINQTPYIDRFEKYKDLNTETRTNIDKSLNKMCDDTTYNNLIRHIELIYPYLTVEEKREVDIDLKFIEEGIMNGLSTRHSLHQKQVAHPIGSSTFGLSPYLSTTYEKDKVYADQAIIVLDVPISQIEDWNPNDPLNDSETNYKGKLNPKNISAILVQANYDPFTYQKRPKEEAVEIIEKVEKLLPPFLKESMLEARKNRYSEIILLDKKNSVIEKEELAKNKGR